MPGPFLLSRIGYTKSQKKMRTKTLNTEVLNNTTSPQLQQTQIIIEQEPTVAPPLPPRSPHEQISVQGTGEVNLPGAPSLHTHSSKFPIEREVIVRSEEKQCKIPNLADYMRRAKPSVAPDAPQKQLAWTHQIKHSTSQQHDTPGTSGATQDIVNHQVYKAVPVLESTCISEPSPIRPADPNAISLDAGPATSTPEENVRGLPSRTYKSLKDIVTRGFSNKGPDTSLSPQSQLRQAGIYLQPQPVQYRLSQQQQHQQQQQQQQHQQQQQQQHQQQQHQQHQAEGYRVYPVNSNYTETPRRDLSKAQSHDNLLGQDNRYRQDGVSQSIYMQQQNQRIIYSGAGPSRVPYFYNSQQTAETQFSHQETPRSRQYGTRHFEYSPEQLASQRRHFAEQQRHNEIQQQRLLSERLTSESVRNQQRSGDAGGGGGDGGGGVDLAKYQDQQFHPQQQGLFGEQQRLPERIQGPFVENRQLNDHCDDNQRRLGEDKQGEIRNQVNQQPNENPCLEQTNNHHDEDVKPKMDPPKLCSQEDDDEGGFVKRGAQSDSGRGSTVYSNAKPSITSTAGDKGGEEWTERVETELRQILSGSGASSDSISSVSPPLPPLSPPASSGDDRPKYVLRSNALGLGGFKNQNGPLWVSRTGEKSTRTHHKQSKSTSNLLSSRIEIDSMLDENNSSDDEDYADTRLIRKQLEGLESMYGQVLKLLKARKQHGGTYEGLDLRHSRRRTCGSISSVPSSVSSRPIRNNRSQTRGKVRDFKGINKRFQRLESHVVTLARSVAHLSSEMRTQHLMMQEMEVMRGELAALRIQTNVQHQQQQQQQQPGLMNAARGEGQGNSTTPAKVKRLTKFFGDEPPLLRLFLRGLGYEKYASLFEKERIGLLELPYLTEDRLHKLGIPLGPRLRILQQAHLANPNTLAVL